MKKIILAFLISLCCITSVSANELDKPIYNDVQQEHPYYDSIVDLTKEGIVGGFGNGIFAPNKPISYDEYTVILMRMFYNDYWCCDELDGPKWASIFTSTAEFIGIYTQEELDKIKEQGITWDVVLRTSVVASDFEPYPFWMYDNSEPVNDYIQDIKYAIIKQGILPEDFDWSVTPTRSQVVYLMDCITDEVYQNIEVPEYLNKFGVEIIYDTPNDNCSRLRNDALYELSLIPEKYLKAFIEDGWKIQIVTNMRDYYPNYVLASGMTSAKDKAITLSLSFCNYNKYILVHEFGHFIEDLVDIPLFTGYMYDFEGGHIKNILGYYSNTNKHECFAEMFKHLLINKDNIEIKNEVKELCPMTFEYIENGLLNVDILYDLDVFNNTTEKYWSVYANN